MLMVDTDAVVVEARLLVGELGCPSCGGALWPWGHARWRSSRRREGTVRHRPRRASCAGCSKTHVLLSTTWLSRRGDAVSVIGSALLAKAPGWATGGSLQCWGVRRARCGRGCGGSAGALGTFGCSSPGYCPPLPGRGTPK